MQESTKRKGRPPGPPKDRVTIYLYESTLEKCRKRAVAKDESLPAYIARNFERIAEKL